MIEEIIGIILAFAIVFPIFICTIYPHLSYLLFISISGNVILFISVFKGINSIGKGEKT